jgi:hypothetical protein
LSEVQEAAVLGRPPVEGQSPILFAEFNEATGEAEDVRRLRVLVHEAVRNQQRVLQPLGVVNRTGA